MSRGAVPAEWITSEAVPRGTVIIVPERGEDEPMDDWLKRVHAIKTVPPAGSEEGKP